MPQPAKYPSNAARQAAYRARCQDAQKQQAKQRGLPPLPSLPAVPGTARWRASLSLAHSLVEEICTQMQTYAEERSEAWQESERAQEMLTRLEALEEVRDQMQTLL
jgi:hypothetical protein